MELTEKGSGTTFFEKFVRLIKQNYVGYLFIMPVILGLVFFTVWPMLNSLYYSFYPEYTLVGKHGDIQPLANYIELFHDKMVGKSLAVTFTYTVISLPLGLILSFFLALLVNWKVKGIGVFRVLYYLPVVIPVTISGILWRDIYNPQWGIANALFQALNIPTSTFFESPTTAMPSLIVMGLFGMGGSMVLWLSALKNVPQVLYESARIDGASRLRMLIRITLPMCSPIIFYNLIMGIIGSLQTFASVVTLVGQYGGKDNALLFYVMNIYNTFYNMRSAEMGYACAMSWLLFVIVAVFTAVVFKTSSWVFYGEEN